MVAAELQMMQNMGKQRGLEIWRINKLTLEPVPKELYGSFYSGDCYIILFTKSTSEWNIHFWIGEKSDQDEYGSAAIFAVQIDQALGGLPVQYREAQFHESALFISYFKSGIKYLMGGYDSGFQHVTEEDYKNWKPRLFHCKGKRNVRCTQVEAHYKALNLGDVFILDNGLYIYVWMPPQSGRLERIKGMTQAQSIRDQERDGRAAICVLDEDWNSNPDFWGLMGGVSKAHKVKSAEAGGSDENFWRTNKQMVALFKVSDESGKMVLTKVAEDGEIKHSMLDKKDAYILDAWNGGIFVWHGKDATPDERKKSMAYAQKYLAQLGRPQWTQVVSVTSEMEPAIFIQWFADWDKEKSKGSVFQPRLFQCSDESGKLVVEEIADFTQEDLDGDDVMILDIGAQIFVWIGANANAEEKKAALERANKYLDTDAIPRKTKPTIYTIHQGSEGPAFKKIFPEWDDTQYKEQKRSVQNIRKVLFG